MKKLVVRAALALVAYWRRRASLDPPVKSRRERLKNYTYDSGLARDLSLLGVIKNTTIRSIGLDKMHLAFRRKPISVLGSGGYRAYYPGMIAAFDLSVDSVSDNLDNTRLAFKMPEPHNVRFVNGKMLIAGNDRIRMYDLNTGSLDEITHPWFAQIHTMDVSKDGSKILVASSGFDAIFEIDIATKKISWQWFAWDHGYNQSKLGHFVTASMDEARRLMESGSEVVYIQNPADYRGFGLPTRRRPVHLNAAHYDGDGNILVTLFHKGSAIVIDRATGTPREVISGMVNPHKLIRNGKHGYFVSSTREGRLIFTDNNFNAVREIFTSRLPGGRTFFSQGVEWLQNTTQLSEDIFAVVDIYRKTLWLLDIKRRTYRGINLPAAWALHDVFVVDRRLLTQVESLVSRGILESAKNEKAGSQLNDRPSESGRLAVNEANVAAFAPIALSRSTPVPISSTSTSRTSLRAAA